MEHLKFKLMILIYEGKTEILLTYLLTPWSRVNLEKLTGFQLVKKFRILWNPKVHYRSHKCPPHLLFWAISIQSVRPHPTSWRSILIFFSHLRLGLPSGLFPLGFPTKTLYTPLLSPVRATFPVHLILLDFITRTILGEEYRSWRSSLFSFRHSPKQRYCKGGGDMEAPLVGTVM